MKKKPLYALPHPNEDALIQPNNERCVMSLIVSTKGELFDSWDMPFEVFGVPQIRKAAQAAHALYQRGERVDQFTIAGELGVELAAIGGEHALANFCGINAPVEARDSYIKPLRDLFRLRRARDMGLRLAQSAMEEKADPDQLTSRALDEIADLDPTADTDNLLDVTLDRLLKKLDRIERGEKVLGISTGQEWFDTQWGGICEGSYYAIAGRMGVGKTSCVEQMISHIVRNTDHPIGVFEKDMNPDTFIERLACRICCIPHWKLHKCLVKANEISDIRKFAAILRKAPLRIFNPMGLTGEKFCSMVRREVRKHKIKAAFLDHVQCLDPGTSKMQEALTKASLAIRRMINDTGVPVVVVAQLNRDATKGRPTEANIKEFDQLGADVDGMTLLWSEKHASEYPPGPIPVIGTFTKNRVGGPCDVPLWFDGERMCFSARIETEEEQ